MTSGRSWGRHPDPVFARDLFLPEEVDARRPAVR